MDLKVAFFDSCSAPVSTINFELIYDFAEAHIGLESRWQVFFAIRTYLFSKLTKASLTNNGSALLTVPRHFRQLEANNAFQLLKCEFLLVKLVRVLLALRHVELALLHFCIGLILKFQIRLGAQLLL